MNRKLEEGEKIFANPVSARGLISRMHGDGRVHSPMKYLPEGTNGSKPLWGTARRGI